MTLTKFQQEVLAKLTNEWQRASMFGWANKGIALKSLVALGLCEKKSVEVAQEDGRKPRIVNVFRKKQGPTA